MKASSGALLSHQDQVGGWARRRRQVPGSTLRPTERETGWARPRHSPPEYLCPSHSPQASGRRPCTRKQGGGPALWAPTGGHPQKSKGMGVADTGRQPATERKATGHLPRDSWMCVDVRGVCVPELPAMVGGSRGCLNQGDAGNSDASCPNTGFTAPSSRRWLHEDSDGSHSTARNFTGIGPHTRQPRPWARVHGSGVGAWAPLP